MDNNSLKFRVARRKQTRSVIVLIAGLQVICLMLVANGLKADEPKPMDQKAPELTGISQWINAKPLTLKDLRGKVVVLHFWTFGCINCRHNLPYYNRWFNDFAKGDVRIVGVHTPETTGE